MRSLRSLKVLSSPGWIHQARTEDIQAEIKNGVQDGRQSRKMYAEIDVNQKRLEAEIKAVQEKRTLAYMTWLT
jgi:hypothetical protein